MIEFIVGLLVGAVAGAGLMHMWHSFTDKMFPIHEDGERTYPPEEKK